jgi:1,2-diacylglycerol 3-alpha-glucosyltransferase
MNICFVIDNVFPSFGGLGRTIERFSKALEKRGHKIVFIKAKQNNEKEAFRILNGIRIYQIKSKKIPFVAGKYYVACPRAEEIRSVLKKENIDVIHLLSYGSFAKLTIKEARELSIPIIMGVHVQPENVTMPLHLDFWVIRKIIIKIFKNLWEKCDCIITPSEFSKKIIEGYGVKKKVFVISNGINLHEFNPKKVSEKSFRKKFNLGKKRFFLYVGRIMSEKNLNIIIESCRLINWDKNPDLRFIIIGDGNDKKRLEEKTKKFHLEDKIIFTGKVNDKLLKSAYKSCEILVHPSLIELEGMVILEAMSFGKPLLLANSKQSASPVLIKKNGQLFNPFNPKDLAEKMIKLINNKSKLKLFGLNSSKQAKKYSFDKSVKSMENLFLKIKNNKNII